MHTFLAESMYRSKLSFDRRVRVLQLELPPERFHPYQILQFSFRPYEAVSLYHTLLHGRVRVYDYSRHWQLLSPIEPGTGHIRGDLACEYCAISCQFARHQTMHTLYYQAPSRGSEENQRPRRGENPLFASPVKNPLHGRQRRKNRRT